MYTLDQPTKKMIQDEVRHFEERFRRCGEEEKIRMLEDQLCENLLTRMGDVTPARKEKLCRILAKTTADVDSTYSLASYHCNYINDILRAIRRGETDYVYNPEWLFEIYHYEPRLKFSLRDGTYYVWTGNGKEGID